MKRLAQLAAAAVAAAPPADADAPGVVRLDPKSRSMVIQAVAQSVHLDPSAAAESLAALCAGDALVGMDALVLNAGRSAGVSPVRPALVANVLGQAAHPLSHLSILDLSYADLPPCLPPNPHTHPSAASSSSASPPPPAPPALPLPAAASLDVLRLDWSTLTGAFLVALTRDYFASIGGLSIRGAGKAVCAADLAAALGQLEPNSLRWLNAEWAAKLDDDVLAVLASTHGASLTDLDISHASRVTDAGLMTLADSTPALDSLALRGLTKVSHIGLAAVDPAIIALPTHTCGSAPHPATPRITKAVTLMRG